MKSAGLTPRAMRALIEQMIELYGEKELVETLSEKILAEHDLMPLYDAVRELHFPSDEERMLKAKHRMKFEELFFFELLEDVFFVDFLLLFFDERLER